MQMVKIMAHNEQQALVDVLVEQGWEISDEDRKLSVEDLKSFAFACDSMIDAIEI